MVQQSQKAALPIGPFGANRRVQKALQRQGDAEEHLRPAFDTEFGEEDVAAACAPADPDVVRADTPAVERPGKTASDGVFAVRGKTRPWAIGGVGEVAGEDDDVRPPGHPLGVWGAGGASLTHDSPSTSCARGRSR